MEYQETTAGQPFSLSNVSLFHGLPEEQVRELTRIAVPRLVEKGEEIFQAGEEARGFYVVKSGSIKIYRAAMNGKEQIIHIWSQGDMFGEVPVFQGTTFPASARALQRSKLLFFQRKAFRSLIRDEPDLGMNMIALLAGRLRLLVGQVATLSLKEVPQRLAAYLLLLASTQESDELRLELPKGQIASYLGTIQETLSRTLRRMAEQEVIAMRGRHISILDKSQLENLASGQQQL
ncbi:CRP/FNR family transcriptional regulator, anaerobic regulatory protein [Paucidesulfovibrio gracilis DSM 16080]|uniref:CRP/FNR family transcriptional regulator, anaerobic regulatory protein n=1 Tax=Paucidesulfovibrio gracilis DSM 16080 TaxID=1121449 RepID=A0A1T4WU07_9BACT|nr:Crp/Fnr family transcriptional regulator [Paucidesulfovibrio gracilis]SKA80843.1 CRP/FNR family transcriptional regulator, anaerobic regulatory protein [Paucidesulfovibrio gracilis DSM 16080]